MREQAGHERISELYATLLEHTRQHFAEEERHMQRYNFPAYPMHKGEHDRVLLSMDQHATAWRNGAKVDELLPWLEGQVADWFIHHVSTMDMMTARHVQTQMV